ncbi:hypothetical protein GS429_01850 [Natronorubrum sp. JWXQ-INN-674]|uniref:DUF7344 domain-containing protein n=1 Tax=Natronorubrum halalkaliphilum TaxID=2691917 RepID=A0A6B0VHK8_9EURY|nr:hypothetical protein [Natronorubrum halalkaliphilum]MXV60833.1 hypothetical protein [Natronorubrum halalkaliphilum]
MTESVPARENPRRQSEELTRDEIFTVLSNRRRRWVLHFLKQRDGQRVDLRTLVDTVSAWEYDTSPEDLPWKKRKRIYTALRQSHLPKLADAGVIEYDRNRGEVVLTEDARTVRMYLEYVPENDIPWSQCYLALSGIGVTITALTWYSVYPFADLSGLALATILVAMFTASAVAHTYYTRHNRLGSEGKPP